MPHGPELAQLAQRAELVGRHAVSGGQHQHVGHVARIPRPHRYLEAHPLPAGRRGALHWLAQQLQTGASLLKPNGTHSRMRERDGPAGTTPNAEIPPTPSVGIDRDGHWLLMTGHSNCEAHGAAPLRASNGWPVGGAGVHLCGCAGYWQSEVPAAMD